jgi:hypothetical protein
VCACVRVCARVCQENILIGTHAQD